MYRPQTIGKTILFNVLLLELYSRLHDYELWSCCHAVSILSLYLSLSLLSPCRPLRNVEPPDISPPSSPSISCCLVPSPAIVLM
ncbi:uncharacterized protein PHALS_15020 [Plasmopara halstedii]|uniref:Uncharacterized protein n=1 Tax=Plasmopara halstedii TaxID=4781 RepID=A0A0P1A8Q0_PLAHL|nr:uncharacterized protein PHALS_15020 [Plasmopara halstedii]CEG37089.1 hypothetical protein PHALS_15020 [Plasmopara halstedii]|eukprot:XP_024573458.1 hypothetical protein PHALS_15020 [Plasmopara halstedii]